MIEQFNRILKAFGSNRIELWEVDDSYIQFRIVGWGVFCVWEDDVLYEWIDSDYQVTENSRWLHAISQGKVRNDAGEMVTNETR